MTFVVAGAGNGHGVGLSQYGALAQARAGRSATDILAFYFPGTQLVRKSSRRLRVLLVSSAKSLAISSTVGLPRVCLWGSGISCASERLGLSRLRLMASFRVIVMDEHKNTTVLVLPFERAPDPGQLLDLPDGELVTVRHLISAVRDGLAGTVFAAPVAPAHNP